MSIALAGNLCRERGQLPRPACGGVRGEGRVENGVNFFSSTRK
jgi:hypothetical protein